MSNKVELNNLTNLQNEQSACNIINNNNDAIEAFSNNVISRDGTSPNQMLSELDMNSQRILNLPAPVTDTEPVRLKDVTTITNPSTGNVTSIATPLGGEAAIFSGTSGNIVTDYTGTGIVKATSGILSSAVKDTDYYGPGGIDIPISDGGTGASTALSAFDNLKQQSTTSYQGVVQLATSTEANTGTDTAKAVTAAGVKAYYDGHINTSLSPYSTIARSINISSSGYTLVLGNAGQVVGYFSTSPGTFTIPLNSSVAFPIGTQIDLVNFNTGKLTIAATSGVTLVSANSLKSISVLYAAATLLKYDTDSWLLFGNLAA